MTALDRRSFLASMACLSAGGLGAICACDKPLTREQVLSSLVLDLAVPDVEAVAVECARLETEVRALTAAATSAQLTRTQQEWQRALLAWKRVHVLRTAPVVSTNALLRAAFWPVREKAIEEIRLDTRPIESSSIEELGVDVKGMYALEHLLFSAPAELVLRLSERKGDREKELLRLLSENVCSYAKSARSALGDGKECATALSKTGQEGLNEIVGSLIATLESTVLHMQLVSDRHALGTLKLADVEGGLSQSSLELVLMSLTACERVYVGVQGRGVSALVHAVSPSIQAHMRSTFASAVAAVRALKLPLERAVISHQAELKRAIARVQDVEVGFKTELASVLGITLSLVSGDGD